ncbi:hypothetical protein GQ44DRAFT_688074 [Phaeosphaeriaceae sp. PMI808]|nr:hypothetical protein GQ44DRAFT_688074 [Phaeosphaeriaceae sp. PMI808]
MSQKRKHIDPSDDTSAALKSFKKHRAFKPGQNQQQFKQRRRPNPTHDDDNSRSNNALKSRIRDLKRLLAHIDNVPKHKMSAGARQERERELEACEHELAENLNASREAEYKNKMIGKYHQVRFFDRQKGTRILKRLKKELAALDSDSKKTKLQQRIHNAEVDVNYATYYPLMKPYSSLYPKSKGWKTNEADVDEEDGEDGKSSKTEIDGPKGDIEMWKAVESAMEEGTLESLRYNKDALPAEPPKKSKKPKAKENKKDQSDNTPHIINGKETGLRTAVAREDEDSDGGFFE